MAGGAGSDGAPPLTELNEPLPELKVPLAAAIGAAGAGTATAGGATVGDTEPAVPCCTGTAVVAAGKLSPKAAGGGGVALARTGTLAALVPAPDGAATAILGAPLETELEALRLRETGRQNRSGERQCKQERSQAGLE